MPKKKSEVFVYIAGLYTGETMEMVERHILFAKHVAIMCARHEIKYFCPHTHSAFMDFYVPGASYEYWMDLTETILVKACNCMVMAEGWESSEGARAEKNLAERLSYPVFVSAGEFLHWWEMRDDG